MPLNTVGRKGNEDYYFFVVFCSAKICDFQHAMEFHFTKIKKKIKISKTLISH